MKVKFCLVCLLVAGMMSPLSAAKKKTVLSFPDGTPVGEWYLNSDKPTLDEMEAHYGPVYSIAAAGAVSSIQIVQTELIQSVIDKAAEKGGVVYIPEGIYKTGALHFKQGTALYLCKGAVLLGSESIFDFPIEMTRIEGQTCPYFPAMINGCRLDDFTISGEGILDGNGTEYWKAFRLRRQWNPKCTNKDEQRPRLVHFEYCQHLTIAGVNLQNSPFWTCHLYKCNQVKVLGVRFFSPRSPVASASADGLDLDVCDQVLVNDCRFTVNDDAVCFKGGKGPYADRDTTNGGCTNVLVEKCVFDYTTGSCMTFGSECIYARNILMRDCEVTGGAHLLLLKMRPDTPQDYGFIRIENVKGECRSLFDVNRWTQFFDLQGREDIPMSYGHDITLKDIDFRCDRFIGGKALDEQYLVRDVVFENVKVEARQMEFDPDLIKNFVQK